MYALAAYTFWGVAPIYFVLVSFAAPLEVLSHRIIWSIPLLALLVLLSRQWQAFSLLSRRDLLTLAVCSALLSVNWLTFIFGIQAGRIAETSLGYFLNPLISICLGALVLGEKLRLWQWIAAGFAGCGVLVELVVYGRLPWVAVTLAVSFALYGLLRKQVQVPAALGLGLETLLLAPFALLFLFLEPAANPRELSQLVMLGVGGLVTVIPLIWFGAAAARLPLTQLGFFQYLAPSLSLVLAIVIYAESVSTARWISFALVWLGLVVFTVEGLVGRARRRHAWLAEEN